MNSEQVPIRPRARPWLRRSIDSLVEKRATTFTATHFPALKAYAMAAESVRAASVLFDPGTKKPLFKLAYDQVGASIALDVAKEHGLPNVILERAEKYLLLDGSDTSAVLDRLNAMAVKRERELDAIELEREKDRTQAGRLGGEVREGTHSGSQGRPARAQDVVKQWQKDRIGRKEARKKLAQVRMQVEDLGGKKGKSFHLFLRGYCPGQKSVVSGLEQVRYRAGSQRKETTGQSGYRRGRHVGQG